MRSQRGDWRGLPLGTSRESTPWQTERSGLEARLSRGKKGPNDVLYQIRARDWATEDFGQLLVPISVVFHDEIARYGNPEPFMAAITRVYNGEDPEVVDATSNLYNHTPILWTPSSVC
jgi:hypothetical protein